MTNERFNELLNGPLSHPMPILRFTRLAMCIRFLVQTGGEQAEQAFEEFCKFQQMKDEANGLSDN